MNKIVFRISGIFFIFFGLVIGFNSLQNITGYVVFENADVHFGSVLALSLILGGIVILTVGGRQEEYSDRESRLREIMGDRRYEGLSEEEKISYYKALRRNEVKEVKRSVQENGSERKDSLRIMVSAEALDRARKDSFIFNAKERYIHEIEKIAEGLRNIQQEVIGDFHVSPQGNNQIRVAWHKDSKGNVYIDDLLYHTKQGMYVDKWNERARKGEINRGTYSKKGYNAFSGKL